MYELIIFYSVFLIGALEYLFNYKEAPMDTPWTVYWTERWESGDVEFSLDFDLSLSDAIKHYQRVIKLSNVIAARITWGESTLNTYHKGGD